MKKDIVTVGGIMGLLLVLYNLIVFLVPFDKTTQFWVAYGFTMAAFVIATVVFYVAFIKHKDIRSRFYGFPIARLGVIYAVIQLIAGFAMMLLGDKIKLWIEILIFAVILIVALIGFLATDIVAEEIQVQEVKLEKNTAFMKSLQAKVGQILVACEDEEILKMLRCFSEEVKYSDPVSAKELKEIEENLASAVDSWKAAIEAGDKQSIKLQYEKATRMLAERNRLCKLNKR